jgi:hypothetical protein
MHIDANRPWWIVVASGNEVNRREVNHNCWGGLLQYRGHIFCVPNILLFPLESGVGQVRFQVGSAACGAVVNGQDPSASCQELLDNI